ncbi:MAG: hypothetical protein V4596_07405 [Bdellovibrionota bacterium]
MKKIIFILAVLMFVDISIARSENLLIPNISEYDSSKEILIKTDKAIRMIYQGLGLNKIQVQMNSTIHEINKEVLTERKTTNSQDKYGGGLSGFLISGSFSYKDSSKSRLDITKIIAANPKEVLAQESAAVKSLSQLRKSLNDLMNQNESSLVIMKELAMIQASAIYEMIQAGEDVPWQNIEETFAMVREVSFIGSQTVTRCLSTNYINTKNYEKDDRSGGLKFRLLFFSLNFSGSEKNHRYHQKFAHSETSCSSTTNVIKVNSKDSVFVVNMSLLDMELDKWVKAIEAVKAFRDQAPAFPTWNSPHYSN